MVGNQHRSHGRIALEQVADQSLFIGPGVGKDDSEVIRGQAKLFFRIAFVGDKPGESVAGIRTDMSTLWNETAAHKLHREVEIAGELFSGLYQMSLDLNAAGVKIQHCGQACNDSKAAAPFAEQVAKGGSGRCQSLQDAIGELEFDGYEGGYSASKLKALNAPLRLAEKGTNVTGQGCSTNEQVQIRQGHFEFLSHASALIGWVFGRTARLPRIATNG